MIAIGKVHLRLPPYETNVVEQDLKDMGIVLSNDYVLCYDTAEDVIYHSTQEIDKAISRLAESYQLIFNRYYKKDRDIHDCIESEIVDIITQEVMRKVCPHSQPSKYFLTLQDYVEESYTNSYYNSIGEPA